MKAMTKTAALVGAGVLALSLASCGSGDPLAEETEGGDADSGSGESIVVGSQAYASNEIIAEVYAQALENAGFEVERKFSIGQRDVYMPSLENGEIHLFPEYTGNLLQFLDDTTEARTPDDVYAELGEALPDGLEALAYAPATDQDSYSVTQQFADDNQLTTIADLANIDGTVTLGGPPELEERPYGPSGAESMYGVDLAFEATGETTVEALLAGTIQVGNVFTADPRIESEGLVPLEDPDGLFLSQNVVPIASADIAADIAEAIDPVSAALTSEELVAMNVANTTDAQQPDEIAAGWLSEQGLD